MKLTLAAVLAASASAFSPAPQAARTSTSLNLNGWSPNEKEFCYGLPGSLAPVGEFDPAGFADGADLQTVKRYREAELQHGRVCKLHGCNDPY